MPACGPEGIGQEAKLSYSGHVLMNRNGLVANVIPSGQGQPGTQRC